MYTNVPEIADGEIVDAKSNEIIPRGANEEIQEVGNMQLQMIKMETVGTLSISPEAAAVLAKELDPKDIKIRPNDGIVYVPWTFYANRLNEAFGVTGWGMVPQGMPMSKPQGKGILVAWGWALIVHGVFVSFAIGETTYQPTNPKMSYADACEGAKSNALARNCKSLGMTLDLWDHDFGEAWKAKYATVVNGNWVKKGNAPTTTQQKPTATVDPKLALSAKKKQLAEELDKEGITIGQIKNALADPFAPAFTVEDYAKVKLFIQNWVAGKTPKKAEEELATRQEAS